MAHQFDVVCLGGGVATDPAEAARGYIHDFHGGALRPVGDRERGVLIGATLVTPRAGEILGGTPLKTLADVIHPKATK